MNEHLPIYNSRVIKNYVEYLHAFYPRIDADHLLHFAGMSRQEVEDPAHWFSQHQIDRFHEALTAETGNPNISREAGRFAAFSKASGPLKRYAMGFVSPLAAYRLLEKITPHITRGGTFKTAKVGSNKMEVYHIPKPGVVENRNQCDNRMGQLEAISKIFTDKFAHISHPTCVHQGDAFCRYIITWHETPAHRWKKMRNVCLLGGGAISLALWFALPWWPWFTATLALAGVSLLCAYRSEGEEKRQLAKSIAFQGDTAGVYLEEMQARYNRALLIQELGQISATTSDARALVEGIVQALERGLDFETGMIMLPDKEKSRLLCVAGYGMTETQENRLRESGLSVHETGHPLVKSFNQREPVLEQHQEKERGSNSETDTSGTGLGSLICVPLVLNGEAAGILVVGNRSPLRTLTQSDVNFLKGIASEIGLSMSKALAFRKLQESEQKYRELVEHAASIILRRDPSGRITFFNEFAERFFGYSQDEILGKDMLGSIVPEEDRKGEGQALIVKEIGTAPEKYPSLELEVVRRNGARARVAWTHRALRDEAGEIKEILCVGNDVTALRRAEEEKNILEAKLKRAQKMEALGTLAGGVAHDLNNILPSLISYPELILMDLPQDSSLRKPILGIKKSGEKAAALAQDLLTLARRGIPTAIPVDVNRVITEYLDSSEFERIKAERLQLQVESILEKDLAKVVGSPIQLYKVVMNLVLNAVEALPEEGRVLIATENRRLTKDLKGFEDVSAGNYAVITVADNGIGIAPEDLEKIFEPFFTKKKMGRSGSGLGMAVVWGAVKDHKGYIDVRSAVGKGTTFTIFLPALQVRN
jgi:PAS domain S-box-containing protein